MSTLKINCISEYEKIVLLNLKNPKKSSDFFEIATDKFKITKHKQGFNPVVITISGFTSEDEENFSFWENQISKQYPNNSWYHLEWNSEKYLNIFNYKTEPTRIEKIVKNLVLLTSYGRSYYLAKWIANNIWHKAVRNSKKAGELLAEVLHSSKQQEFILIGHSLGARLIFNCLTYSHENNLETNIHEIHLLGGAVTNDIKKWKVLEPQIKSKIYNYYSKNDYILTFLYKIGELSFSPVGLGPIQTEKVDNRDVGRIIKGHTQYIPKFNTVKNYKTKLKRAFENAEVAKESINGIS